MLLGFCATEKSGVLYIHTYLLLYTYTCNNSTGFAFASAMNLSDYISHNSLYNYNTIYNHIEKKAPS